MVFRTLLLLLGVYCCSTAVIMIKACTVSPIMLSAYRLIGAGVVLLPLFLRDYRNHCAGLDAAGRWRFAKRELTRSILPGILLAAHFITWILGARMTPATNSSLVVNMIPVVMPFVLYMMIREKLTRGEWAGTGFAMVGLVVLVGMDFRVNQEHLLGDALCFGSMLFFTVYLALGRRNRDAASIWLYIVPLYLLGGVMCLITGVLCRVPFSLTTTKDVLLTLGLILIPTILGHSILLSSVKHMRGQVVSLTNLAQFMFAGAMAFFLYREIPAQTFYVASVLIVIGAIIALKYQPPLPTPEAP